MGIVPESAESARRAALAREGERRRAVTMLQIAEVGARYASQRLSNGTGPEEARAVCVEMAAELSAVAAALRRLAELGPAERRRLARQLAARGWTRARIA